MVIALESTPKAADKARDVLSGSLPTVGEDHFRANLKDCSTPQKKEGIPAEEDSAKANGETLTFQKGIA